MVRKKDLGIGFHYINGELIVNLNKIFFRDIYESSDLEVAVDGYLILEKNIEESLKQETLEKIASLYKKMGIKFVERIKSGRFNILVHDKKDKKFLLPTIMLAVYLFITKTKSRLSFHLKY
ncbi:MAG: hypothetical protein J7L31_06825 [Thermoplasmata archaeon]|nr:hypothetical protein [Thermoplasmata archaeon]